jgi:hypothetical protein
LSRRLGDDPLNRARTERAKTQGEAPVPSDLAGQATAVVQVPAKSRASYNDVFFQRRGAGGPQPPVAGSAPDAPEITEISEIPEIHEAAAASTGQSGMEVTHVESAEPVVAAQVSIVEEAVSKPNAVAPAEEQPAAILAAAPQAPEAGAPEPEKTGGFFKRLFGKFK